MDAAINSSRKISIQKLLRCWTRENIDRVENKVDDFMEMFLIRRISMSIPDFEIGGLQLRCAVIGY